MRRPLTPRERRGAALLVLAVVVGAAYWLLIDSWFAGPLRDMGEQRVKGHALGGRDQPVIDDADAVLLPGQPVQARRLRGKDIVPDQTKANIGSHAVSLSEWFRAGSGQPRGSGRLLGAADHAPERRVRQDDQADDREQAQR